METKTNLTTESKTEITSKSKGKHHDNEERLLKALKSRDLAKVDDILSNMFFVMEDDFDINCHSTNGWTPLHYAVSLNNSSITDRMLSLRPDLNARTADKEMTPLHLATSMLDAANIRSLLEYGGTQLVRSRDKSGRTPLDLMVSLGASEKKSPAFAECLKAYEAFGVNVDHLKKLVRKSSSFSFFKK